MSCPRCVRLGLTKWTFVYFRYIQSTIIGRLSFTRPSRGNCCGYASCWAVEVVSDAGALC